MSNSPEQSSVESEQEHSPKRAEAIFKEKFPHMKFAEIGNEVIVHGNKKLSSDSGKKGKLIEFGFAFDQTRLGQAKPFIKINERVLSPTSKFSNMDTTFFLDDIEKITVLED